MAQKKLSEGALDKCLISFRAPTELKYKILQAFGNGGERNLSDALLAACEYATRGVKLDDGSLKKVLDEQVEAYRTRLMNRVKRDLPNGASGGR